MELKRRPRSFERGHPQFPHPTARRGIPRGLRAYRVTDGERHRLETLRAVEKPSHGRPLPPGQSAGDHLLSAELPSRLLGEYGQEHGETRRRFLEVGGVDIQGGEWSVPHQRESEIPAHAGDNAPAGIGVELFMIKLFGSSLPIPPTRENCTPVLADDREALPHGEVQRGHRATGDHAPSSS